MKKGELTSFQIITTILVILGFVIVALVVARFAEIINDDSPEEVCRLSVLTRATAPDALSGGIPLKCTTQKTCITSSRSGECAQFAGEKDVRRVVLRGDVSDKTTIEREAAEAMYRCWSMMGQGKLDLFGNFYTELGLEADAPTCVICSRLAISDDVPRETLDSVNVNEYMRTHQVPGSSLTYLQTFTDRETQTYATAEEPFKGIGETGTQVSVSGTRAPEFAFVFSQIKTQSYDVVLTKLLSAEATVAGATFATPVIGNIAKSAVKLVFGGSSLVAAVTVVGGSAAYAGYNNAMSKQAAAGYCGTFTSNTGGKDPAAGCSIVQAVPYSAENVNTICPVNIQGIP